MLEIFLLCAAVALGIMAIPVIGRMIVGPTIIDRAVGLDMLLVYVVMGLGLYTAWTGTAFAIIPALALTGTGFIGTLALARFVARAEQKDGAGTTPIEQTPGYSWKQRVEGNGAEAGAAAHAANLEAGRAR